MKTHILRISMIAAGSAAIAMPVHAQQTAPVDTFSVTVSSRLPAASALRSVDIIDRRMIDRLPTRTISEAIARSLGTDVLSRSPAQSDLSLRGSTTEQVLVMIDGVPMNDTQTGHFHLDQNVPLDQVERIEILRGTASSAYGGGAIGGIVNIVTRSSGTHSSVRLDGGSFKTIGGSATAGMRLRDVAPLDVAFEHYQSDGHRAGTDYETNAARASLSIPAGGGTLRMDAGDADRKFGAAQFYGPFATAYEETRALTGGVSYDRMFGRVRVAPRASIRKHYDDFVLRRENPSFYHNVHRTTDAGGGLVLSAPFFGVQTALGGESFNSTLHSTNLKNHSETRAAVFGEVVGGDGRRITGSAGLRNDHSSRYGDFLSPSFAVGAQVVERVRVRASAARGFRAPTWTDRYYSDPANRGDSTLQVERAWSYEAGVDATPFAGIRVDATGFVRDVTNAIDWVKPTTTPTAPWQIINIQSATFRGAELRVRQTGWLGADWTVRASALSFEADSAAGYTSKYALRPLTETASLEVGVPLPFGFDMGVIGSHLRRSGEKAYHILDAQLGYNWREWNVYVSGTNLGDQPYLDVSAVRAPGRALNMGVRWQHSAH